MLSIRLVAQPVAHTALGVVGLFMGGAGDPACVGCRCAGHVGAGVASGTGDIGAALTDRTRYFGTSIAGSSGHRGSVLAHRVSKLPGLVPAFMFRHGGLRLPPIGD